MRRADHPAAAWVLAGAAFLFAALGAIPHANGYNDGGRLATAESLIDRGTLCIDESIFANPSHHLSARGTPPYTDELPKLAAHGTKDKVRIDRHFYSDKPPIPAILTAAAYRVLMFLGLPSPGERPDVFCRVSAILVCGISYAAAVGFMWALGRRAGLAPAWRLCWLASFALATVLPAYTRQVNPSLPQTAAIAGLCVFLSRIAGVTDRTPWGLLAAAGCFAGLGYCIDLGGGPPLLACATLAVILRTHRVAPVVVFLAAAAPWMVTHHAITFGIGHVWVPLGMVPEFLDWPGSEFDRSNMTGFWRHTPLGFVLYFRDLLISENGLLTCNLPLFLAVGFGWKALRKPAPDRLELATLLLWCVAVFGVYAVLSDNGGGGCLSIRWFVPFLVPGFWLLARLLVEFPAFRPDFVALSTWGLLLGAAMWTVGPWPYLDTPFGNAIVYAALTTWGTVRVTMWRLCRRRG